MQHKETPEERKARLIKQLEKARIKQKEKKEAIARGEIPAPVRAGAGRKRPKNLDKIIREILDDESFVDAVVANQPGWWNKLPHKTAGYIMSSVMAVKAMGGDIKAAEWIAKRGFGDKVILESDNGFFSRDSFTIQVVPSKNLEEGIKPEEVLEDEIKQIEKENEQRVS
jgi:hypothetical protein